ncbi:MAG: hypothetical protein ACRDTJ_09030, partial [Pseudonocardiaceae bacterium]
ATERDLAGQGPGRCVAWFVEPDCLGFSVGGESVAFAVGSAPGVSLLVKVFDFVPEGAGADLGDEEGAVVGAVYAGGGPGVVEHRLGNALSKAANTYLRLLTRRAYSDHSPDGLIAIATSPH